MGFCWQFPAVYETAASESDVDWDCEARCALTHAKRKIFMVFSASSSFSSIIYSLRNDGHNVLVRLSPSKRFVLSVVTHVALVVVINRERAHTICSKFSIGVAPFNPVCTCTCVCLCGGKMDISSERFRFHRWSRLAQPHPSFAPFRQYCERFSCERSSLSAKFASCTEINTFPNRIECMLIYFAVCRVRSDLFLFSWHRRHGRRREEEVK